ncbi:MAG: hypothetical protein WBD78_10910 [Methylocella sp.]
MEPLRNRTKMFHVKHFGTIGLLGKHTFAKRGKIGKGIDFGTIGPPGLPNLGGATMLDAANGR